MLIRGFHGFRGPDNSRFDTGGCVQLLYVLRNPRTGFLVMSLQKDVWRGTATFIGIHTVYFLDLVEHTGRQALPMGGVVAAYVAPDGYPRVVPILQAQAASRDRILFSPLAYRDDLDGIPAGASLAVFGMTLKMEDVLMRGRFGDPPPFFRGGRQ